MNDFGYGVTNNADNADVTKDNNGDAIDLSKSNGLSSPDDNDSTTDLDKNKNFDSVFHRLYLIPKQVQNEIYL